MPVRKEKRIYVRFVISISLVIALALSAVFFNMEERTRQLMNEGNLIQARVVLNTILLTRKWNAGHGGVFVKKRPGVQSNRYLVHPDIRTEQGEVFTMRNPALMTREISELAAREGIFRFHLTSLNLVNPENRPDEFETAALKAFDQGRVGEMSRIERISGRSHFRYMAPAYVEQECLQCHMQQKYGIGDVRGGISITFDIEDLLHKVKRNTFSIMFFGIVTIVTLLSLIHLFTAQLIRKLADARLQIEKTAITDELTGLFNRRHILSRFAEEFEKVKRLQTCACCIIADIDHFKAINDQYGHLKGDEVLRQVAAVLKNTVRGYDIAGRYGGEEFLIILPDTDIDDAKQFAERMRVSIKDKMTSPRSLTMSFGVTSVNPEDRSVDDIIKRADAKLYQAKNAGRDRVE